MRATVLLHIAEYFIQKGERKKAEEVIAEAEKIIIANPKAAEGSGQVQQLAEVKAKFEKMPK